jgi:hypothetical protein
MNDDNDRDLHEAFQTLRRATKAEEFRGTLAGLARRRSRAARLRRSVLGVAVAAAVVAALVIFGLIRPREQRGALVDLATAHWEGPTDFLLRTPGAELLRTIPTFTSEGRLLP